MSTPASGFPDYQNLPQWRGSPFTASAFLHVTTAAPYHAEAWVTNWQALQLAIVLQSSPGVQIAITYYTDSTKAVQVGFYIWTIGVSGGRISVCAPNIASYLTIDITTNEAGTRTLTGAILPVNIPVPKPAYQVNQNFANALATSINAGATFTAQLPTVVEGDGYFAVRQHAGVTGFNVEIDQLTEAGAVAFPIYQQEGLSGTFQDRFVSTSSTLQISVTNNDAAARTFDIYCTSISR